jgi:myo-inositol 2-dehydrogenase/D-chiro-inositol 1-dehydrogenase/scyllo-inositol 2-dehydrogenase (NAD+)
MVGAGRVGDLHSSTVRTHVPGAELSALVDAAPAVLEKTGGAYGYDQRFTSLEQALDGCAFDAVVITTPTFTHLPLTLAAAARGKHVFCEKPMAMTLAECDQMIDACKRAGVLLQIGFMRRFDPDFVLAAERIAAGEIGEPMLIKSLTHGPGLPPMWANDIRTSNGMLAEVNSHDLDCVRWLMGSPIDRIYLEVANFKGVERGVPFEHFYDNMITTLKFESGGLGSISGVCPCDYGYDARVEIVGKKGIMQIGSMEGRQVVVCIDREEGLVQPIYRRWPERFAWGYIREIQHFVQCIQSGTEPRVTGVDGRWAVAGVIAGTRSLLEERPVRLAEVLDSQWTPAEALGAAS